jgi:hypothetical protein
MEPNTVPHKAMDMMKKPWNQGEVCHSALMGKLAPDMTTVSNPKMKPARAAMSEMPNRLDEALLPPGFAIAGVSTEICIWFSYMILQNPDVRLLA